MSLSLFGIIHHGDGFASVLFYKIAHELIAQGWLGTRFNLLNEENGCGLLSLLWLPNSIRPTAGQIFFVLPYLESWRTREDVWLRTWLASLFDYQLQGSVDVVHPICADLFNDKKSMRKAESLSLRKRPRAKDGEELNYREINDLARMDGICRGPAALLSLVTFVWRLATEDTVVPLHFPIPDPSTGVVTNELLIAKGTRIYTGLATNRSAAIWGPHVYELKPERWFGKTMLEGTKGSVKMPGVFSNTWSPLYSISGSLSLSVERSLEFCR
ncbi:hypothetical protein K443DRAFT_649481 [Laccaria amethystina LaAM-08-1]|uniref:Uncharacterized protein n=1 Tax=Laccaria amethystina LaAM-08-1 TaxID=1095629 RepID=A0A0C9WNY8_9AGAR|nr:hypothetical protein K443DRAFT_649481 [Laccaria amethystina LaAM-08-1]